MPTPPGSTGFTPWTHQLDLQLDYRPAFAGNRLDFQLQVHNVFNEQKVTQISAEYGTTAYSATANTPGPMPDYLSSLGMEAPRYVQFGITYDYRSSQDRVRMFGAWKHKKAAGKPAAFLFLSDPS